MSDTDALARPVFLIVDDDPLIVHALARTLRPLGKVSFTSEFDRVHVVAAMSKPKVILIDIDLPQVTGLDIAKSIRGNPDLDSTQIVLMTSHRAESVLKAAEELSGNHVVSKPIDFGELTRMVRPWI